MHESNKNKVRMCRGLKVQNLKHCSLFIGISLVLLLVAEVCVSSKFPQLVLSADKTPSHSSECTVSMFEELVYR